MNKLALNLPGYIKKGEKLVSYEEAINIITNSAMVLDAEKVSLRVSLNRILAEDIISDIDMPPFDKSAMDGYACRKSDLRHMLTVIETIPAGSLPEHKVLKYECSKIMTGAMIPKGADCVVMIENSKKVSENEVSLNDANSKVNIFYKAEDIRKGDVLLSKGTLIKAQHIAVLASAGCSKVPVAQIPKVGIIATGDELVEPWENVSGPKIRNSNSYQLVAQAETLKVIANYYGIGRDNLEDLNHKIKQMKQENDIIIFSGGVSMGDFDLVPKILKSSGFKLLFEKIKIKPGKPVVFGVSRETEDSSDSGKKYCFGLPGNPVSTFASFELLVKPFIYLLMGHKYEPKKIRLPLLETIKRKESKRKTFIPITITDAGIKRVESHGSAHISSLPLADGLISIPIGMEEIREGTKVDVRQI